MQQSESSPQTHDVLNRPTTTNANTFCAPSMPSQQQPEKVPLQTTSTTEQPITRFEHFCFEADDASSIILNYSSLVVLLKTTTCDSILVRLVMYVRNHLQRLKRSQFTMHLFCQGLKIRGIPLMKNFIIAFAKMFKQYFPTELQACYVHYAPSFFVSVYDLLRPILPKESRDKIILLDSKRSGVPPWLFTLLHLKCVHENQ